MAGCDTTIAPPLLSIPEGVQLLPDPAIIIGDLLEVRASEGGLCVAVLDCDRKRPALIGVSEEREGELRALVGRRIGIGCIDCEHYVADFEGRCL